jgi:hypothetical protein
MARVGNGADPTPSQGSLVPIPLTRLDHFIDVFLIKQIYKNHIGYRIVIEASRYVVGTTFRESGIRVETVSLRRHTVTSIPSAEQARRRQQMKSVIPFVQEAEIEGRSPRWIRTIFRILVPSRSFTSQERKRKEEVIMETIPFSWVLNRRSLWCRVRTSWLK